MLFLSLFGALNPPPLRLGPPQQLLVMTGGVRGGGRARRRGGSDGRGRRGPAVRPPAKLLTASLARAESASEVLRLHADHGSAFNEIHLATCWSRLASTSQKQGRASSAGDLAPLRQQTVVLADTLGPRAIASTAHALARLGHFSGAGTSDGDEWDALWRALGVAAALRVAEEGGAAFGPQGLSLTAWAFAKASAGQAPPQALLDAIAVAAIPRLHEFKAQELANLAWAYGKSEHAAPALLDAIAAAASPRLDDFKSQELANLAWAYGKSEHAAPALLDKIAAAATPRLGEFQPQGLANTAWAFAKAGHPAPSLFEAITLAAVTRLGSFKPQELANTAWACATAQYEAPPFYEQLAYACRVRISDFNAQELANTAWAFAKLGHPAPRLLSAVAVAATRRAGELKPQELASTAWSFAVVATPAACRHAGAPPHSPSPSSQAANHSAPLLFDAIAQAAVLRVDQFGPRSIALTAWAFSRASHASPALFDALAARATPLLDEFDAQGLANLAWSFAAAGRPATALFDGIAAAAGPRLAAGEYKPQELASTAWAFAQVGRNGTDELVAALSVEAACLQLDRIEVL